MRFSHISYEKTTGAHSKRIESYNFHKAAAVLAEYGFDCVRLADDWKGLTSLPSTSRTMGATPTANFGFNSRVAW